VLNFGNAEVCFIKILMDSSVTFVNMLWSLSHYQISIMSYNT